MPAVPEASEIEDVRQRLATAQKELTDLRLVVGKYKRAETRYTRVRNFLARIVRRGVFGPNLDNAATGWWQRVLEEKSLPVAETGQLSAAIIRRFVRIGIIAGVFMLAQFVFVLIQVLLLAQQNTKIEAQNRLFHAQNQLLLEQTNLTTRQTAASEATLTNALAVRVKAMDEAIATIETARLALVDFKSTADPTVRRNIAELKEVGRGSVGIVYAAPFVGLAEDPCRRAQTFAIERGEENLFHAEIDTSPAAVEACEHMHPGIIAVLANYTIARYEKWPAAKPSLALLAAHGVLIEFSLRHHLGRGHVDPDLTSTPLDEGKVATQNAELFRDAAVSCQIELPRVRKAIEAKRAIDLEAARAYNIVIAMFPYDKDDPERAAGKRSAERFGDTADRTKSIAETIRALDRNRQAAEQQVHAILESCQTLRERTWREFRRASEWVSP